MIVGSEDEEKEYRPIEEHNNVTERIDDPEVLPIFAIRRPNFQLADYFWKVLEMSSMEGDLERAENAKEKYLEALGV